jgi:hypothetical protein
LRNQLSRKELLAVLCSVFWFWFLSFCFPSLFVCERCGFPHNTSVEQRVRQQLKALLEAAAAQQAESSTSR